MMADNTPEPGSNSAPSPTTVVVERGGSNMGLMIGIAFVLLIAIAGYFVMVRNTNDQLRTEAIGAAAKQVGDSAEKAGAAAEKAVDPDK
jgi:hypothetical protein